MRHFKPEGYLSEDGILFEQALLSGGDARLAVDSATGRNMYRVPPRPDEEEIWLSSSTASPITKRGYDAAGQAFQRWQLGADTCIEEWSASVRERLLSLFGIPGAAAVLCPSGTDAEMVVLALALDRVGPAVTNIVLAPGETGRGVPLAAAGRHSSSWTPLGGPGMPIESSDAAFLADVEVETVEIRTVDGRPRKISAIDTAVHERALRAVQRGRGVILHCLDASKTGLSVTPVETIAAFAGKDDRCIVVVDACQLRCPAQRIRDALNLNQIVIITGSKFAGGPPFSGAVLLPPGFAGRLPNIRIPESMRHYCALTDWPKAAHKALRTKLDRRGNPGILLRWEAALAELERFDAIPRTISDMVANRFRTTVIDGVEATSGLYLLDCPAIIGASSTIVPVITLTSAGEPIPGALVQAALAARARGPKGSWYGRAYRVGQPVVVAGSEPVRICLSAPQLSGMAQRVQDGQTIDRAFQPFDTLLSELFAKWAKITTQARDE